MAEFEREQREAALAKEAEAAALAALANGAAFGEAIEEDEDDSSVEACVCSHCSYLVYDGWWRLMRFLLGVRVRRALLRLRP